MTEQLHNSIIYYIIQLGYKCGNMMRERKNAL